MPPAFAAPAPPEPPLVAAETPAWPVSPLLAPPVDVAPVALPALAPPPAEPSGFGGEPQPIAPAQTQTQTSSSHDQCAREAIRVHGQ